ncbi:hypothetical protein GJ496_004680 [Pomphorhynchus laevis]|nr:hypothetical protein GJ496_004680 [Pomphorhynchus laevis]
MPAKVNAKTLSELQSSTTFGDFPAENGRNERSGSKISSTGDNSNQTLGNDVDKAKNCDDLLNFLNQATIMVVSVSASATQGTELSTEQLQVIDDAYQTAIMLNNHQEYMFKFIESRMTFIAPNLTALLGASVAAKIIGKC